VITIIDYSMGNLRSVEKAFERLKIPSIITSDKKEIEKATKIVLPGVGHFANGMKRLREYDIVEILNYLIIDKKIPILGICLGMQLMAQHSEEGNVDGLNWIDANVVKFKSNNNKLKIPQMGWNNLYIQKESKLTNGINESDLFYFVHSYHFVCNQKIDVLATTEYFYHFSSAIERDNILGVQFHPEKSQNQGMQLLENFARI